MHAAESLIEVKAPIAKQPKTLQKFVSKITHSGHTKLNSLPFYCKFILKVTKLTTTKLLLFKSSYK